MGILYGRSPTLLILPAGSLSRTQYDAFGYTRVEEPTEIPELPKAKVTAVALNIRRGPGTDNSIVGLLQHGEVVDVIEKSKVSGDIWLRIGHEQYIAMRYNDNYLAVWK